MAPNPVPRQDEALSPPVAPRSHPLLAALSDASASQPLSEVKSADGRSVLNPSAFTPTKGNKSSAHSDWYDAFQAPFDQARNGYDLHIYFTPFEEGTPYDQLPPEAQWAVALRERIRKEFPELRVYRFWHRPIGPHTKGMFEVNVFTPQQLGGLLAFLTINRGPLSILIHPNTDNELTDHRDLPLWFPPLVPLYTEVLKDAPGGGFVPYAPGGGSAAAAAAAPSVAAEP